MSRLLCWWFGCVEHPQAQYHGGDNCKRCGQWIEYADRVGDTRHNRLVAKLSYFGFRKWWPSRCGSCGKRFGDHSDCLPF